MNISFFARELVSSSWKTFLRFPLALLACFAATVLGIYAIEFTYAEWITPHFFALAFAIPMFLSIDIFAESWSFDFLRKWSLRAAGVLLYALMFFFFYSRAADFNGMQTFQAGLLQLLSLGAFCVSPFLGRGNANGFWAFTVLMFQRFLQAFSYFGVLFVGLALLLTAIDYLFQVNLPDNLYMEMWVVIVGVLSMFFYFSGIPTDYVKLQKEKEYPGWLRVVVEYLAVPLVFMYFLVLYLYTGMIVFTWEWPMGDVATWITGFSLCGVWLYIFGFDPGLKLHGYVQKMHKILPYIFIPQIVVLFVAVGFRLQAYGITESRYFLLVFGIWLFINSLYFIISKKKDIRIMPITFIVFALFATWGPFSASTLAFNSQMGRLETMLVDAKMVDDDGHLIEKSGASQTYDVNWEIVQQFSYLDGTFGREAFADLLDEGAGVALEQAPVYETVQFLNDFLKNDIQTYGYYDGNLTGGLRTLNFMNERCSGANGVKDETVEQCPLNIAGFSYYQAIYADPYNQMDESVDFTFEGKSYIFRVSKEDRGVLVLEEKGNPDNSYSLNLAPMVRENYKNMAVYDAYSLPLIFDFKTATINGELYLDYLGVTYNFENDKITEITNASGFILFSKN